MSQYIHNNNYRLAKNTVLLYVRMIVMMIVTLYTSRIILNALGIEDYGIYNVVAGFVSMLNLISASITVAITRFITFELGKTNHQELDKVFSTSINIQIIIIFIVILIAETAGGWFLNCRMVIPLERIEAANYVYQATIFSLAVTLYNVPYNAAIIAHEKMSAFAYIGILDAVLKLVVAFATVFVSSDKLIVYGILTMLVSVSLRGVYTIYCKMHFSECTYHFVYDKVIMRKMFAYSGWTYIGTSSALLRDHGGVILINLFFGPIINAARGISLQVQSAVNSLAQNFMTAINPQIIKSYASGDIQYMKYLISKGTRFGYYLVLLLSLPILINTEYILQLWLKIVPPQAVELVRLSILFVLSESISNPLITSASANGNIKTYQLLVGGIQLANFPITYILFKFSFSATSLLVVAIILSQCCLLARLYILRKMIALSAREFICNSYCPILLVTLSAVFMPLIASYYLSNNFLGFSINIGLCLVSAILSIFFIGLVKSERQFVISKSFELKNIIFSKV